MRSITDTISRLSAVQPGLGMGHGTDRLSDLADFGANPGALRARLYVPEGLAPGAPLVVVLHGCTQTASAYDHGSGWSEVADRCGFALLFPEQTRTNNPNLCFNWFQSGDTTRNHGEVGSIAAMIAAMIQTYHLDSEWVFITGLSAGGAMACAMIATYPEVFAGAAIIAGLPYGIASSVPQALDRMRGHGLPTADAMAQAVRDAAPAGAKWPRVAVWHGSADATVAPATGEAVIAQWRTLHGLASVPSEEHDVDGHPHRIWRDASGAIAVEAHAIAGMGHGTPLDTVGEDGGGAAGAYMLDVGTFSTLRIATSWGLTDTITARRPQAAAAARGAQSMTSVSGVGQVIEDALRSAGLMR